MNETEQEKQEAMNIAFAKLRKSYLKSWPEKLGRFHKLLGEFEENKRPQDTLKNLRTEFHRLAGSGGSYGLPKVSEVAHGGEMCIDSILEAKDGFSPETGQRIQEHVLALEETFNAIIEGSA